jgi:hypothetical protein
MTDRVPEAGTMDAKAYLSRLKVALERGYEWSESSVVDDVLKVAHLLRCLKLCEKLAHCYLCVHHPNTNESIVLKIESVPHPNIDKLREQEAVDFSAAFVKALHGVNTDLSHVTLIQIVEGRKLEVLLYFRDACNRLMGEKGWTILEDLPWLVANEAKKRGLSNTVELTISILLPKADPAVEELLIRSGGKLPLRETIGWFLAQSGMPTTRAAIEDVRGRCVRTLLRQGAGEVRGAAKNGVCQNPTCSKTDVKRLFCGKCKRVAYCSAICQKEHWGQHKKICVEGTEAVVMSVELLKDVKDFREAYAAKSVFL